MAFSYCRVVKINYADASQPKVLQTLQTFGATDASLTPAFTPLNPISQCSDLPQGPVFFRGSLESRLNFYTSLFALLSKLTAEDRFIVDMACSSQLNERVIGRTAELSRLSFFFRFTGSSRTRRAERYCCRHLREDPWRAHVQRLFLDYP